ncbi:hypothetical protein ABT093_28435 [Kitasatospora sp. NPDC002551]|uniref:hypothetical protein n=1 Tax=unclassified Kitasatospora TaxID=2633591 RepID=UPI00332FFD28
MTEQNPYGAPPPPAGQPQPGQPYGGPPVPPQAPPPYGAPAPQPYGAPAPQPYGAVPPQPGVPGPPGAPGYPAYGAFPAAPPPRRSRRTLGILIGVFVLVLALIGGAVAYFVFDVTSNAGTQKVVLPTTFNGLSRDENNEVARQMEDAITAQLGKGDGGWNPTGVSAVYQDATEEPKLVVLGAYGKVLAPKTELNAMFKGLQSDGTTVSDRHPVDPGPKGGSMECGTASQEGTDLGVCAWSDSSSLVMVMSPPAEAGGRPDLDKLASDTRALRAVAEIPK